MKTLKEVELPPKIFEQTDITPDTLRGHNNKVHQHLQEQREAINALIPEELGEKGIDFQVDELIARSTNGSFKAWYVNGDIRFGIVLNGKLKQITLLDED